MPSELPVAERYAVFQSELKGGARDSSSDAESVAPDRPCRDVTEVRVTSGAESRTEADCGTRTPPGHPQASRKEAVNASLDTTVPVMEVPLASSSSGVIDFPRRGIVGAGRTTAPARGIESPREREPIGLEQVIADMAALMGGTLKTIAETQRAMAARGEGTGEPHRPIPFIRQVAVSDEELDGVSMESSYSSQETREMQLGDSDIHDLLVWKEEGVEPTQAMLHLSSPAVRNFWQNKALLEVRHGVLFYRWVEESGERSLLVVPHQLKQEVMRLSHDLKLSGHPGMQRTLHRLRQRHIWHKMNKDCKLYVLSCKECNRQKKASVKPRGELGMFHAGAPVERLHIDILGPFPQSVTGNRYILMLVCQFTKWLEAYPLPEQTAEQTARVVVDHFTSRFGVPEQIHTDQGRNFTSKLFEGICKLLEITKTRTTPYWPCSNGQVERYNRTILQLIRCHLQGSLRWDEDLPLLTSAIRSVPNRQTGFTPNMLMLGREVRHPADLLFGVETAEVTSMPEFVTKMQERFRRIHDLVREKLKTSQVRQKKVYDQHLRQATYQVGDVVYRRNDVSKKGQSKKLVAAWKGPFLIQEVLTPVLFRVQGRKKASVLHHDLLKSCHDREIPLWIKRARHALEKSSKSAPIKEVTENALGGLKNLFKEQNSVTPVTEPGDQSDEGFNGNGVIEGSISTPIDIGDDTDPLSFTWVQCENPHCLKWRKISSSAAHALTDDPWYCNLNEDLRHNTCGAEEESSEQWEQDLEDQGLDFTIDHHAPSDSVPSASAVPSLVDAASFVSDRTRHGRATRRPVRYQD